MRIMLDTNILISMFLFPSNDMNRLKHNICENHSVLLCSYVIAEIKDVVNRKFKDKKNELDLFFQSFPFTLVYTPEYYNEADYPVIKDVFDLPVLVSAILEEADILITGDKDFSGIEIDKPEILTPSVFLKKYGVNFIPN